METKNLENVVEKESWSNDIHFISGFANGFYRIADVAGALVSHTTNIRTLGGSAWRGEIEGFGKKHPTLNTQSPSYKLGRGLGFFLGGVAQYTTYGLTQGIMGGVDVYLYFKNKRVGAEKYPKES